MLGQIIMMVVAVAVTAWIAPWATGLIAANFGALGAVGAAVVGGAIAGAAGSIASQVVGIGIGAQSGFNWKGVAMGAIGGAIGGGMGAGNVFGNVGGKFISGALRGLVSSVATQGIGVATGLQKKFDWAGVAGAAIGGGVGNALGAHSLRGDMSFRNIMANVASSSAGAIANAGARSLIEGSDFGDNLIAALPDIIGSTVGNMLAASVGSSGRGQTRVSIVDLPETGELLSSDDATLGYDPSVFAPNENLSYQGAAVTNAAQDGDGQTIVVTGNRHLSPRQLRELAATQAQPNAGVAGDPQLELRMVQVGAHIEMRAWQRDYRQFLDAVAKTGPRSNDPEIYQAYADEARRILHSEALVRGFDSEFASVILLGPRTALGMVSAGADFTLNGIDYMQGDITFNEMLLSSIPGSELVGAGRRIFRATDNLVDAASAARRVEGMGEESVLFGQRRIDPIFSTGENVPSHLAGRPLGDVSDDLINGRLHPDQLPINAFYDGGGNLISANSRTLAALSDAGMRPTRVNIINPNNRLLSRLTETPLSPHAPLPGRWIAVTPSRSDLTIERWIQVPGR
jgi:hypothetical protein